MPLDPRLKKFIQFAVDMMSSDEALTDAYIFTAIEKRFKIGPGEAGAAVIAAREFAAARAKPLH